MVRITAYTSSVLSRGSPTLSLCANLPHQLLNLPTMLSLTLLTLLTLLSTMMALFVNAIPALPSQNDANSTVMPRVCLGGPCELSVIS
jgi:hypothetical protein